MEMDPPQAFNRASAANHSRNRRVSIDPPTTADVVVAAAAIKTRRTTTNPANDVVVAAPNNNNETNNKRYYLLTAPMPMKRSSRHFLFLVSWSFVVITSLRIFSIPLLLRSSKIITHNTYQEQIWEDQGLSEQQQRQQQEEGGAAVAAITIEKEVYNNNSSTPPPTRPPTPPTRPPKNETSYVTVYNASSEPKPVGAERRRHKYYQKVYMDLLKCYFQVMNHYKIDSWALFGTMLGVARGEMPPWDGDIDVGIKMEDQNKTTIVWRNVLAAYQKNELDNNLSACSEVKELNVLVGKKGVYKVRSGKYAAADLWPHSLTKNPGKVCTWICLEPEDVFPIQRCEARRYVGDGRFESVGVNCPANKTAFPDNYNPYGNWRDFHPYNFYNEEKQHWTCVHAKKQQGYVRKEGTKSIYGHAQVNCIKK